MSDFPDPPDAGDEPNVGYRVPRRLAAMLALDEDIEAFMNAHLDAIDRKAPLPPSTIAGVNVLLARSRNAMSRSPAHYRTAAFPMAGPVRPWDALLALMKIRHWLDLRAEAMLVRRGIDPDTLPELPARR